MASDPTRPDRLPRLAAIATVLFAFIWSACVVNWLWVRWHETLADPLHSIVAIAQLSVLHFGFAISLLWVYWATQPWRRHTPIAYFVNSVAFLVCWQWAIYTSDLLQWTTIRTYASRIGAFAAFFIGLAWVIWLVERAAQYYDSRRRKRLAEEGLRNPLAEVHSNAQDERTNNPLDPLAWYYGRRSPRLHQSYAALTAYCIFFFLVFTLFSQINGCKELYEMPAGGGEQKQIAQQIKIQKIIKKKFVVNPYSAISFKVPPIDEVKLQLNEITEHAYTVGYGEGAGAGFAGGTNLGQVRFIRLEYAGGDWDQDFGIGADVNMLIEYGVRTKQKVAKQTESRTVPQLRNFPAEKSPPMVYITGQRSISMSESEIKVLREYLLEKHGMIFGDNGGSAGFHNQFVGMMRRILPNVRPTRIPLDDKIHRIPYQIPFLPYVAPHGGKDALGWRVDGRLVCYYHPGDIGDAWADDHAGVPPEVYEACYQLGTNVIFYAHSEYSKWLSSRKQGKK